MQVSLTQPLTVVKCSLEAVHLAASFQLAGQLYHDVIQTWCHVDRNDEETLTGINRRSNCIIRKSLRHFDKAPVS